LAEGGAEGSGSGGGSLQDDDGSGLTACDAQGLGEGGVNQWNEPVNCRFKVDSLHNVRKVSSGLHDFVLSDDKGVLGLVESVLEPVGHILEAMSVKTLQEALVATRDGGGGGHQHQQTQHGFQHLC